MADVSIHARGVEVSARARVVTDCPASPGVQPAYAELKLEVGGLNADSLTFYVGQAGAPGMLRALDELRGAVEALMREHAPVDPCCLERLRKVAP